MKLLILFTAMAFLQAAANGFSQTVTLRLNKVPLEKAFKEIKRQTGFSFVYTRAQLQHTSPVTCELENRPIAEALERCFVNQPLSYILEGRYVVVVEKDHRGPSYEPIDITGRIVDEQGNPLAGISVRVKDGTAGTVTDEAGHFSLAVPNAGLVLVISGVNIETLEFALNGKTALADLVARPAVKALETVVINKGYYSTTQQLNTGAVSVVTAKEIDRQPVSNPISALQGRVPGMLITQKNGLPGSNLTIQIRGQNSIQQGNEPLYIVDGVPFASENMVRLGVSLNASNPFNTINPADVESIEVLKDADATAIYGSRGANGVVLITTKKGKAGKIAVDVNLQAAWGRPTRTMKFMNTAQYLKMRHEAFKNDGMTPAEWSAPDLLLWDTTRNIDWKKRILGGNSATNTVQTRISGGTKWMNYSISSGFYREGTVLPGSMHYTRGTFGANLSNLSADKKFSFTFSTNYAFDQNNLPSLDIGTFVNLPPDLYEPFDQNGQLQWSEGGYSYGNVFSYLRKKYKTNTDRLMSNLSVKYQFTEKFSFRANFNYNAVLFDESSINPIASQNPAYNPSGSSNFYRSRSTTWNIEPQVDYATPIFGTDKLQIMLGASWQQTKNTGTILEGYGYTNDAQINSIAGASTISVTDEYSLYRFSSWYGRLNYSLKDKVLLNVVGRTDASSRFGPDKRYANFGAVGIGWIFSRENWVQRNLKLLSFGKIRASWGTTGNDRIGDYRYFDTWSNTPFPYQGQQALQPTRLFNPNYGWELIRKEDLGVDLGFIQDRVFLTLDLYRHRSDNQLVAYNLPDQTGFSNIIRNIPATIENKGIELMLNTVNIKKGGFSWKTSFNLTIQRNKLVSFKDLANSSYAEQYKIGKPLNLFLGYTFLGVDPQTGIYQFVDRNKDGYFNTEDYGYLGTTDPKFFGGLGNTIQYSQFELSLLFDFRKQTGRHAVFGSFTAPGRFINQPVAVLDHWEKPGDQATYQQYTRSGSSAAANAAFLAGYSSAVLTDASFIRLRNVSLSYSIPERLAKKARLRTCKFYLQAQNLFTLTHYIGADPENQSLQAVPPLRVMAMGLNLNF